MIDWSRGYTSAFYMSLIDPNSWRDMERIEITGGDISFTGDSLRQSASVDCRDIDTSREHWIRIWAVVRQDASIDHVALFTGLTSTPEIKIDGNHAEIPVECYSVLKAAQDVLLPRGWYAGEGMDGIALIRELLKVTHAPITVEGTSEPLSQHIIAEDGESHLSMVDKILKAIGMRLNIKGDGSLVIRPLSSSPVIRFGMDYDILQPTIDVKHDRFGVPNVFRVISDSYSAVARDDSADSPYSTVTIGREIWMEESSADLSESETLAEYAVRRLKEEQSRAVTASYDRRFVPDLYIGDMVYINYPNDDMRKNLLGNYVITEQSFSLEAGLPVSESVTAMI